MTICAVVVLYEPQIPKTEALINTLMEQGVFCIVVDNSQYSNKTAFSFCRDNLVWVHNDHNVGIAAAQNIGLTYALENEFTYAFLFDQDSEIASDFVESMCESYSLASLHNEKVVALGPKIWCYRSSRLETPMIQRALGTIAPNINKVSQIIASGMFINMSKLPIIGFKDESLFIDGVDHEWCWRARQKGYEIGQIETLVMRHELGDERVSLGPLKFKIGRPIRLYYQTRNLFILIRRDYVPLYWKVRNLLYFPAKFLINTLLVSQRIERLGFLLKGLIHGIREKTGKYS